MALSRNAVQYIRPDVCLVGSVLVLERLQISLKPDTLDSFRTIRCRQF